MTTDKIHAKANEIITHMLKNNYSSYALSTCDHYLWDRELHRFFPYISDQLRKMGYTVTSSVNHQVTDHLIIKIPISTKIRIGKPVNGVTINVQEYLLDDNDKPMLFDNIENAKSFLRNNGYNNFSDEDIDDSFTFEPTIIE